MTIISFAARQSLDHLFQLDASSQFFTYVLCGTTSPLVIACSGGLPYFLAEASTFHSLSVTYLLR